MKYAEYDLDRGSQKKPSAEADIRKSYGELKILVQVCTAELVKVNEQLRREIEVRRNAEIENVKLIGELRNALMNSKTLSGLIPICACCKNIRDDTGDWSPVDAYIGRHTLAKFSHSICPTCAKKRFPEYYPEDGERK